MSGTVNGNGLQINIIKLKISTDKRNQALQNLLETENISQLKKSIKLIAEAECWPRNMTVSQWGNSWKEKYTVNDRFDDLINKTSSLFYSSENNRNINELSLQLYKLIQNRKRR